MNVYHGLETCMCVRSVKGCGNRARTETVEKCARRAAKGTTVGVASLKGTKDFLRGNILYVCS